MIIFPAIDIKDKKCVRLTQGDFDKVNVYGEDPSLMAKKWADYGAEFIHVVNLNGSRDEIGINDETLAKVAKAVDVPIQVGGGIRDEKRVKELLDLGINRVIVGTMAIENKELLKELKYDRLYLNTPVRPPAEADVNVVSEERMRYAVETLGGISIEMMSSGAFFSEIEDDYEAVKSIIGRHPMNQFEVRGFLESRDVKDPEAMMEQMKKDEAIHVIDYKGILTFRLK